MIQSADGAHMLKIGGLVQLDGVWLAGSNFAQIKPDTFQARRVRVKLCGQVYKNFKFVVEPAYDLGIAHLRDAYLDVTYFDPVNIRVGVFKAPISGEDLQDSAGLHLMERSLLNSLVPIRDAGIMIHGNPMNIVEYQLAIMNGVVYGGAIDLNDDKDYLARVMLRPAGGTDNKWIKDLKVGAHLSWGYQGGGLPTAIGRPGFLYTTPSGLPYFLWTGTPTGDLMRYGAELSWYAGPVHLNAEWMKVEWEINANNVGTIAWYIEGGFVLTGEDASPNGITPKNNFDPRNGKWGAMEIALRFSTLDTDLGALPPGAGIGFTNGDECSGCLNWYLNPSIKTQLMYSHTTVSDIGGPFNITDDAIMFRFQLSF
jgi:phosphate-selective porin OprO/OprP